MRYWAALYAAAVTAFGSVTSPGAPARRPRTPSSVVELGELKVGEVLVRSVPLVNTADEALAVRRVRSSCECLTVLSYPLTVPPHQSRDIWVRFLETKPRGFNYTAWVEAEGSTRPARRFVFRGKAVEAVDVPAVRKDVIDPRLLTVGYRPRSADVALSVGQVLADHRTGKRFALVDVRTKEEYGLAHIPGSLHIPAHALKHKQFLREREIVLISQGFGEPSLEKLCLRLRESGFGSDCRILEGGLNAWRINGGPVVGKPWDVRRLGVLDPGDYHRTRCFTDWRLVEISAAGTQPPPEEACLFLERSVLPGGDPRSLLNVLNKTRLQDEMQWFVIFDEKGDYGDLPAKATTSATANVFFLDGGWRGYETYLVNQTAIRRRTGVRQTSAGGRGKGCSGCP